MNMLEDEYIFSVEGCDRVISIISLKDDSPHFFSNHLLRSLANVTVIPSTFGANVSCQVISDRHLLILQDFFSVTEKLSWFTRNNPAIIVYIPLNQTLNI